MTDSVSSEPAIVQLGDGKFVLAGQRSVFGYRILFHPINEALQIGGDVPENTPLCAPIAEIRFKGAQDIAVLLGMLQSMHGHSIAPNKPTWRVTEVTYVEKDKDNDGDSNDCQ